MINITYAALHICAHNAILNSKLKLELVEVGVELGKNGEEYSVRV